MSSDRSRVLCLTTAARPIAAFAPCFTVPVDVELPGWEESAPNLESLWKFEIVGNKDINLACSERGELHSHLRSVDGGLVQHPSVSERLLPQVERAASLFDQSRRAPRNLRNHFTGLLHWTMSKRKGPQLRQFANEAPERVLGVSRSSRPAR
jgi:hypothetical protein